MPSVWRHIRAMAVAICLLYVLADALLALNAHVTFVLDEGSNAIVEILKERGLSIISGADLPGKWPSAGWLRS